MQGLTREEFLKERPWEKCGCGLLWCDHSFWRSVDGTWSWGAPKDANWQRLRRQYRALRTIRRLATRNFTGKEGHSAIMLRDSIHKAFPSFIMEVKRTKISSARQLMVWLPSLALYPERGMVPLKKPPKLPPAPPVAKEMELLIKKLRFFL